MYDTFATVYDVLMQDAPYDEWLTYLSEQFPLADYDVLDVGCGTGTLTVPLAVLSRSCIGIDPSEPMLARAQAEAMEKRAHVHWLCQDVRTMRLPKSVDLAIATCDVMNYLVVKGDVQKALKAVSDALSTNGIFAFDVLGPARVDALRSGYWHHVEEHVVMLHETMVDGDQIWHDVHAFVDEGSGLYRRIEERHHQVYYPIEALEAMLHEAGFRVRERMGDFGKTAVHEADRVIFVAEKSCFSKV